MKSNLVLGTLVAGVLCMPIAAMAEGDSSRPAEFIKDSAITTAVKTKLAAQHISSLTNVHVDTDKDGVVWLTGTVDSQDQADQVVAIVRDTDHVTAVHNDLVVKPK